MQAGGARVLCIADVRGKSYFSLLRTCMFLLITSSGNLKSLNDLARQARADYVIHTGDFRLLR